MFRLNVLIVAALAIMAVNPVTVADPVTSIVLFYDDFEGVSGVTGNDLENDADPVAKIGLWEQAENQGSFGLMQDQVQASGGGLAYLPAAAYEGKNYLSSARGEDPTTDESTNVMATWRTPINFGVITADFRMYIPSVKIDGSAKSEGALVFGFTESTDYTQTTNKGLAVLLTGQNNQVRDLVSYSDRREIGVPYAYNKWQHWVVETDFTSGVPMTTVSVDGVTSDPFYFDDIGNGTVANCFCLRGSSSDHSWAYDNVSVSIVPPPGLIPGDANLDFSVDEEDAAILAAYWLQSNANWLCGDFNADNMVNDVDAAIMATNWSAAGAGGASAPEPGTAVLLLSVIGWILTLLHWQKRNTMQ